jgi:hypothetical protein
MSSIDTEQWVCADGQALGGPFWCRCRSEAVMLEIADESGACFIFAIALSMAVSPLQKGWLR